MLTATERQRLADAVAELCGGTAGRRLDDPVAHAVMEGRQGDGYSGCHDLGHLARFLVGCRDFVYRREAGQKFVPGAASIQRLVRKPIGIHPIARELRSWRDLQPGDTLVLDATNARAHVNVVIALLGAELVTGDYGQHPLRGQQPHHLAARVRRWRLSLERGKVWVTEVGGTRHSPIDSWLPLGREVEWQRKQGTLAAPMSLDDWLSRHGLVEGPDTEPAPPPDPPSDPEPDVVPFDPRPLEAEEDQC